MRIKKASAVRETAGQPEQAARRETIRRRSRLRRVHHHPQRGPRSTRETTSDREGSHPVRLIDGVVQFARMGKDRKRVRSSPPRSASRSCTSSMKPRSPSDPGRWSGCVSFAGKVRSPRRPRRRRRGNAGASPRGKPEPLDPARLPYRTCSRRHAPARHGKEHARKGAPTDGSPCPRTIVTDADTGEISRISRGRRNVLVARGGAGPRQFGVHLLREPGPRPGEPGRPGGSAVCGSS